MVTSATAGEGKTSFCAALARVLALSDLKVLLVDTDLHRPRIAHILGLEGRADMQQVVRGEATLEQRIQVDPESGAHVLTAMVGDGPNLLLSSAGWVTLVDAAREQYDVVIVDTPPVTAVPDAVAVGLHADLNLFLLQWGGASRRTIAGAVRFLRLCAVHLDGIVITGIRSGFAPRYSDPYELAIRTNARLLEQLRALPPYPRSGPTGQLDGSV
jgi:Mrp family chromosome partitioning ATPase